MSQGSMLLYAHIHRRTTCTSASFPTVSPLQHSIYYKTCVHYSHQVLPWHHHSQHHCSMGNLRVLRDTGNTCHGSPDLGEGSSRAHTCTTCPWNAKRKRQDYRCTCMCGDSRGCPTSSGDKLYVHTFTNVLSTLYGVIAWKRFEGATVFRYPANVFCHNANERACHVAWREHVRAGIT